MRILLRGPSLTADMSGWNTALDLSGVPRYGGGSPSKMGMNEFTEVFRLDSSWDSLHRGYLHWISLEYLR